MMDDSTSTQSITVTAAETIEACVNEYIKEQVYITCSNNRNKLISTYAKFCLLQISNYFTEKLLNIVCDILRHFKGENKGIKDLHATHVLPCSYESQGNKGDAALEFIKHVCAVLALDQNVKHDVLVYNPISFILFKYIIRRISDSALFFIFLCRKFTCNIL